MFFSLIIVNALKVDRKDAAVDDADTNVKNDKIHNFKYEVAVCFSKLKRWEW